MRPYRLQEVRLSLVRSARPPLTISEPADVARAFGHLASEVRESFYALFCNAANEVICVDHVSTGNTGTTAADPAEIIRTALLSGARGIAIVHNHPSGSPTPSPDDYHVTRAVAQAAALFHLQLLDHVIIGKRGSFYSFRQAGTLPHEAQPHPADPPARPDQATHPPLPDDDPAGAPRQLSLRISQSRTRPRPSPLQSLPRRGSRPCPSHTSTPKRT
jgi:DNA repair protein RadC